MTSSVTPLTRREALAALAAAPLASAFACTRQEATRAQRAAGTREAPTFFTDDEYETVRILVDLLIPRDERSGSATDALVPEFIDFLMTDQPERQLPMRGGLAWIDVESQERFDLPFRELDESQRGELLDAIAYPDRADASLAAGVEFFSRFRDLTATGFFSSKMGVEDLQYMGNEHVTEWTGCPREALDKLGLL